MIILIEICNSTLTRLTLKHKLKRDVWAGKKKGELLPDNTNLLPLSLRASRSLLRNVKEALKGTGLVPSYKCDRLNTDKG